MLSKIRDAETHIKELKEVRGPFGLPIERDISFDPIKEKELMSEIERGVA